MRSLNEAIWQKLGTYDFFSECPLMLMKTLSTIKHVSQDSWETYNPPGIWKSHLENWNSDEKVEKAPEIWDLLD